MHRLAYLDMVSECKFLEKMIAEAPASAVIDRMSLESRLEAVREEMEEMRTSAVSRQRSVVDGQ